MGLRCESGKIIKRERFCGVKWGIRVLEPFIIKSGLSSYQKEKSLTWLNYGSKVINIFSVFYELVA